jgi:hypothetical protein
MKLITILFLLLPVVIWFWLLQATRSSHTFQPGLFDLWIASAFVCLAWGLLIVRRRRLLGGLCVVAAMIHLVAVAWPFVSNGGVKIHTEIIEHETNVA